ncbi:MAG: DEAD/DEAH box helicase family protein, partial [Candidatus Calescibacterium sp.]|nr:DEAD/DEAH box helicase family protein [Candidatus Calescibacterium sp.]
GNDYSLENDRIPFHNFINRMSFWMATGSGKTLVIVKLIELLANLIENGQIPHNDILFLTYREDLIQQFESHVHEFNSSDNSIFINLLSLKDYEKEKRELKLPYRKRINVFYYRSDLISDEQKEKIVDFRNYDNFGKWYILLDEAHKGDKEDSKRQLYYSILSRNGFLFNFSATFAEDIDFVTCVFNFNLEKFIQQGYGKHIYISKSDIRILGKNDDFTDNQKKVIILKILLLHTLIRKFKLRIGNYYHYPLILALVNSVNTEDSDLFLFFKELEKMATGKEIDQDLLIQAKEDLLQDLKGEYEFERETLSIHNKWIEDLEFEDILENVFNTSKYGTIEVLKIPGNKQELVLKLKTTEKPFGLIKIGDISEWLKNKLSNYEIVEKFDNESVFKKLNTNGSDINILMGSRAFYEGWDSDRPNIILYINIGHGNEAKKFVLQSIGRGVRIQPLSHKRKRLLFLFNDSEVDPKIFNQLRDNIQLLETLFVFGTKAKNLKEITQMLKEEIQDEPIGDLFQINPEIKDKTLLIPVYVESENTLAEKGCIVSFQINSTDLDLLQSYYNYIGDKVALIKYDCQPRILTMIKGSFRDTQKYYHYYSDYSIGNPEILMKNLIKHFSIRNRQLGDFKPLENEIVHFKSIRVTKGKREEIRQKIEKVLGFREKEEKLLEIVQKIQFEPHKALEYAKEIDILHQRFVKQEIIENEIFFRYVSNHYYIPIAVSQNEKQIYISHVIKTDSEAKFINELEKYLNQDNNLFKYFDWWFFSKIDEMLDDVYIPYYQPKTNRIEKFKPDFIFWFKKNEFYYIVFVDPKTTEYTDAYRKIDGYINVFVDKKNEQIKTFDYMGFKVRVYLFMFNENQIPSEKYKDFWVSKVGSILEKLLNKR